MRVTLSPGLAIAFVAGGLLLVGAALAEDSADALEGVAAEAPVARYERTGAPLSGQLAAAGSDTLSPLVTLWAEGLARHHPGLRVRVHGGGSAAAAPRLAAGTAQLGPMLRRMRAGESAAFEERFGYPPTAVRVAMEALAVFVHPDNPVQGLSLRELDGAFSRAPRRGGRRVRTWGGFGRSDFLPGVPIDLYGCDPASASYVFFRQRVLQGGEFRAAVTVRPASAMVTEEVGARRAALGYGSAAGDASGVRKVPLRAAPGMRAYPPTREHVLRRDYPLCRDLYVYVAQAPGQPPAPAVREFLRYALSREGQAAVAEGGFLPLDEPACAAERARLR